MPPEPANYPAAPVVSALAGEEEQGITIDFGRILGALKKYLWVLVLFLVAGIIASVSYINIATPIYESYALLRVEQRVQDVAPLSTAASDEDLRSLEMIGTIQRGFMTRSLMQRIVEKLKLVENPSFLGKDVPEADRTEEACVAYLLENTKTEVVRGTRYIMVKFDHPDSEIARQVTEALVNEYIALDGEQRFNSTLERVKYLQHEVDSLREKVETSKKKLNEYAEKLESVSVTNEMDIIADSLLQYNKRLAEVSTDRLKLEADFEQINEVGNDPEALLRIESVNQLPAIQELRGQINTTDADISAASSRYGSASPQMKELVKKREALQESLYAEALHAPKTLEITLRAAKQNEESLERQVHAQEKKVLDVKRLKVETSVLQGQIDADTSTYQAALQGLNAEISQARSQPVIIQIDDPASPPYQVWPKPLLVVAIAVVATLALACGVIFLIALLDTSFKSVDEVERALGLPVLAAIPHGMGTPAGAKNAKPPTRSKVKASDQVITVLEDKHSTVSEAFRTLRASLQMVTDEQPFLLLTSAVPSEGKSFCALNLAAALAQQDKRTILIDSDLRKPVVEARVFGEETGAKGFSDFLAGRVDFDEIVRETKVPNLFVITAGRTFSNPSELLSRKERVANLLKTAAGRFDRIVFDSAPVLAVSDTLSLAGHFPTIALVIHSHKTPSRFARRAVDLLARAGQPPVGITMNQVPTKGSAYQYYHYNVGGYARPYGRESHPQAPAAAG